MLSHSQEHAILGRVFKENGYYVCRGKPGNMAGSSAWTRILVCKSCVKLKSIHHQWGRNTQAQGQLHGFVTLNSCTEPSAPMGAMLGLMLWYDHLEICGFSGLQGNLWRAAFLYQKMCWVHHWHVWWLAVPFLGTLENGRVPVAHQTAVFAVAVSSHALTIIIP